MSKRNKQKNNKKSRVHCRLNISTPIFIFNYTIACSRGFSFPTFVKIIYFQACGMVEFVATKVWLSRLLSWSGCDFNSSKSELGSLRTTGPSRFITEFRIYPLYVGFDWKFFFFRLLRHRFHRFWIKTNNNNHWTESMLT